MLQGLASIRARLTLINLGIVTATLLVVSAIVLRLRQQELLADFDERIRSQAEVMLESIQVASDAAPAASRDRERRPRQIPFRFPGCYFQLRLADGTVLEKSASLHDLDLPMPPRSPAGKPWALQTVTLNIGPQAVPETLRLLTVFEQRPGVLPFYFQIGRPLAGVRESIADLQRILLILVPLAVVLAGIASYLFSRRALAPIRDLVRQTRELSAERLHTRLPVPQNDDEVAQLAATLNELLERVDAAFTAQDRFIANASHELRTPISVIMGMTSVLKQQGRTVEEYDRFASNIEDEVRGLANTINSLLILSRASAGLPPSATRLVAVNDVIMEAVARCQSPARQREVRLVTRLVLPREDDAEPTLRGDAQLLATLFGNLLRNAIRFSPPEQTVEITAAVDPERVCIQVRDHGPGIPAEHLDRVFDRFYSVSGSDQGYQGVGLGLAIVKGVAEIHQGSVRLRNHPAGGCEFTVTLPLARPG